MANANLMVPIQAVASRGMDQKVSNSSTQNATSAPNSFNSVLKATDNKSATAKTVKKNESSQSQSNPSLEKMLLSLQAVLKQVDQHLSNGSMPLSSDEQSLKKGIESLLARLNQSKLMSHTQLKQTLTHLNSLIDTVKKAGSTSDPKPSNEVLGNLMVLFQVLQPIIKQISNHLGASSVGKTSTISAIPLPKSMSGVLAQKRATDLSKGTITTKTDERMQPTALTKKANSAAKVTFSLKSDAHAVSGLKPHANLPDLPKPKGNALDPTGSTLSSLLGGQREMGKVQQFLFHNGMKSMPAPTVAQQIENQIKAWMTQGALKKSDGQLSVQLQLHPENLGSVELSINQTENGLTASITAHSAVTKDLIDSQLGHLQQSLAGSGISVQKLDVMLAPSAQQTPDPSYQQPEDQGSANHHSSGQQAPYEEDTVDQESFENWLQSEGMSV